MNVRKGAPILLATAITVFLVALPGCVKQATIPLDLQNGTKRSITLEYEVDARVNDETLDAAKGKLTLGPREHTLNSSRGDTRQIPIRLYAGVYTFRVDLDNGTSSVYKRTLSASSSQIVSVYFGDRTIQWALAE